MRITKIELNNFRKIKKKLINIDEKNIFLGENGIGKSTIIDALDIFFDNEENEIYSNLQGEKIYESYKDNTRTNNIDIKNRISMLENNKYQSFKIKIHFDNNKYIEKEYKYKSRSKTINIYTNIENNDDLKNILAMKKEVFKINNSDNISLGENKLFGIIDFIKQNNSKEKILLIDEFDALIHINELKYVKELLEKCKAQIFLTSNNYRVNNIFDKKWIKSLHKTEVLLQYKKLILVEGKSDKVFLTSLIKEIKKSKNSIFEYEIVSIAGQESNTSIHMNSFNEILNVVTEENIEIITFFDKDEAGKKYNDAIYNNKNIKTKKLYYINGDEYNKDEEINKNFTLESFLLKKHQQPKYKVNLNVNNHNNILEKQITNLIHDRFFEIQGNETSPKNFINYIKIAIENYEGVLTAKENCKNTKPSVNINDKTKISPTKITKLKQVIIKILEKDMFEKTKNLNEVEIKVVKKCIKKYNISPSFIKSYKKAVRYYANYNLNVHNEKMHIYEKDLGELAKILGLKYMDAIKEKNVK